MFMWGHPALICALLASALLLRRMPLVALAVTLAGSAAPSLAPQSEIPASALQVVVACAAGLEICYMAATRTRAVSVAGVAMASAGLPILILELPSPNPTFVNGRSGTPVPLVTIAVPLVMIIAWLIGNSIRQAQARAELVRAQAAAQTALAERLRIARELHDIVAHSIGIIAIQAGAAGRVFDARPAEARDALAAIEATSRETLSGLRRMVTGLRRAEPEPGPGQTPLGPAPGLGDIERLAAMTLGADFSAGPCPGGGFRVAARLPVPAPAR
jgi:signal transduction histidine kinase